MRKGVCIHYSGAFDRLLCKADVSYLDLVGGESSGWMLRLPCLERNNSPLVCEKRQFPTDEAIQKWDDEFAAHAKMIFDVVKAINAGTQVYAGTTPCPKCGKTIHWNRSHRNRHLAFKCETPSCLVMIQ
jgi:predicted RNA-binding Zn-ribbon protein involved in translation (DUF1610 family)